MESIIAFDRQMFLIINGMHNQVLDFVMFWLSDKYIWIPFYALLLFLLIKNNKRQWWLVVLSLILLVTLTDQISVKLFKDVFLRLRPCHEPLLEGMVRTLNGHCGGSYGFVSSHAANTFGLAVFVGTVLRSKYRFLLPFLLIWAALISYSRVYLGVHYPGDVIAGGIVGALTGYLLYLLFLFLKARLTLADKSKN